MRYDSLLNEANKYLYIYEKQLDTNIKGLQAENVIWINKNIPTRTEKLSILVEELGHYHTSYGNILDQSDIRNRKQELRARQWGYEKIFPLEAIIQAHKAGIKNKYELAEFIGVTEEFIEEALKRYIEKFGVSVHYKEFTICFEPLGVVEWFEGSF